MKKKRFCNRCNSDLPNAKGIHCIAWQVTMCREPSMHAPNCLFYTVGSHLHRRANSHFRNQASGQGDSDFFLTSVNVNSGITTASDTYIVNTTETNSIMTLLEIYFTSITEHNRFIREPNTWINNDLTS